MKSHRRMLGDTLRPLNAIINGKGGPLELSPYEVKFQMETEAGVPVVAETATGVVKQPTQAFTRAGNWLLKDEHGVQQHDQIVLASSDTLPGGLAAGKRYYATQVHGNRFQLAEWPGGPVVPISSDGDGTHTFYVVGSVQFAFEAEQVASAGRFAAWFTVYDGAAKGTAPVERKGVLVEVLPYGADEPPGEE